MYDAEIIDYKLLSGFGRYFTIHQKPDSYLTPYIN